MAFKLRTTPDLKQIKTMKMVQQKSFTPRNNNNNKTSKGVSEISPKLIITIIKEICTASMFQTVEAQGGLQ